MALFPPNFAFKLSDIKQCILDAYPTCPKIDELISSVQDFIRRSSDAQQIILERKLTALEAEAICIMTADMKTLGCREDQSVFAVYMAAIRLRDISAIERWQNLSFLFISGLQKLETTCGIFFQSDGRRIAELSEIYTKGKQICCASLPMTFQAALGKLGKGGTLLKLFIESGRDIRRLSLKQGDGDIMLSPASILRVELLLSSGEARLCQRKIHPSNFGVPFW